MRETEAGGALSRFPKNPAFLRGAGARTVLGRTGGGEAAVAILGGRNQALLEFRRGLQSQFCAHLMQAQLAGRPDCSLIFLSSDTNKF